MTYSIIARDPASGELGVAVQSHWFSVGPVVPWAAPGVGAVATQANAEVAYGPHGLALLGDGLAPADALARLLAGDPLRESRQVALIDARGAVAAHTGSQCMAFAGDGQGEAVSCQANIMASARVWPAMLEAYAAAEGALSGRLLAALRAAEAQGGDLRGRQSAAILVVPAQGEPWETVVSLRVEDHPEPLGELERLLGLHDAYRLAGEADEHQAAGRLEQATGLYRRAFELAPGAAELRFWAGLGAAQGGDLDEGAALVGGAIADHAGWRVLLARLPADIAPPALVARLGPG